YNATQYATLSANKADFHDSSGIQHILADLMYLSGFVCPRIKPKGYFDLNHNLAVSEKRRYSTSIAVSSVLTPYYEITEHRIFRHLLL
ncbi:hypothetical protein, partial [Escherichia marmotae]|uniref:hypothetical protein n=1 Tax=Escherichia marmotae TaxID=1499973 RepID=UPI0034D97A9F